MKFYHGGIAGKAVGQILTPSAPIVTDNCPVCVARASGMAVTAGEYRKWLRAQGPKSAQALKHLEDAPDDELIDPPSGERAVYVTSDYDYALFYAARSKGDLYAVEPIGEAVVSTEDHFPTWICKQARIVSVVKRNVRLDRRDRRRIDRRWKKADKVVAGYQSAMDRRP